MGNYADPEEFSWSQPGLSFKRITPFSIDLRVKAVTARFQMFLFTGNLKHG